MDFLPAVFVRRWIGGPTLDIFRRRWMRDGLAEHLVRLLLSTPRRPQGARTQPRRQGILILISTPALVVFLVGSGMAALFAYLSDVESQVLRRHLLSSTTASSKAAQRKLDIARDWKMGST